MALISSGFHSLSSTRFRTDQGTEATKIRESGYGATKRVSLATTTTHSLCAIVERINRSEEAAQHVAQEYRLLKLFGGVAHVAQLFCPLTNTPEEENDQIGRDGYLAEFYHANLTQMALGTNRFSTEILKTIAIGACKGLQAFHAKGWAHRDIKPDNIFCENKDGTWVGVLGDFDFAQDLSKEALLSLPIYGTPKAHSPQACQLLKGQTLLENQLGLKEADIWEMGLVLFFAMYRELPEWVEHVKTLEAVVKNVAPLTDRAKQLTADPRVARPTGPDLFAATMFHFLEPDASKRISIDIGVALLELMLILA